jgi:hypothetical protein
VVVVSRLFRRPARYLGQHRPGVERLPLAVDPWAQAEAFDAMTDTALLALGGVA